MSRSFRGESLNKIDGKGRVSIPAAFRRIIEAGDPNHQTGQNAEFIIVYGDEDQHHLECYTIEQIAQIDAQIEEMPDGSDEREFLEWIYGTLTVSATVDETGRIVIPAKQREKVGLVDEAKFIGSGDKFQIWKPETYDAVELPRKRAVGARLKAGANPRRLLSAATRSASET